ncbi:VAMP-associated protein [Saitozyma sp. JCM 24511]|nr:VAMP-associated protein [Saitozyma sp. JCM 24511]
MSVEITPANQLGFPRPLTRLITKTLKIHNPHPHPVAFKVKTTAPKQYCVRPNAGRVESGESVEVQVLLQPLAVEPPPHAKCKDKFLVQSAFITPDEEMRTLTEMWLQTEKTNKGAIQEQKIRCAYVAAEDGGAANGIPEEDEAHEASRLDESAVFAAAHSSPIHATGVNGVARSLPVPVPETATPTSAPTPADAPVQSAPIPSLTTKDIAAIGASPTNVALEDSLAKTTTDSEKLKIALAEIDRLRAQLTDAQGPAVTGLRKRGGAGATPSAGAETTVAEKAKEVASGQQGVPIEVVAALLVGVFVMTYLFF